MEWALLGPLRAEEATAHYPIQTNNKKQMETETTLKRQTKDALVARLIDATKDRNELSERVMAAAIIGGTLGFLIGIGW
jgi:hypothetical protein